MSIKQRLSPVTSRLWHDCVHCFRVELFSKKLIYQVSDSAAIPVELSPSIVTYRLGLPEKAETFIAYSHIVLKALASAVRSNRLSISKNRAGFQLEKLSTKL